MALESVSYQLKYISINANKKQIEEINDFKKANKLSSLLISSTLKYFQ